MHREHVDALVGHRVGRLGLAHRHGPVAGEDGLGGDRRVDRAGAQREGVDVAQHLRDRLGGHEAQPLGPAHVAGDDAAEVLRLVDVAEEAAGVGGVPALGPQAAGVGEAYGVVPARDRQHVRVEVAEAGREQQARAVLRDHALHGPLHGHRFGDVLLLDDSDAGDGPELRGGLGVRLVVAEVVARADVDHADRDRRLGLGLGLGQGQRAGQGERGAAQCAGGEKPATGDQRSGGLSHGACSLRRCGVANGWVRRAFRRPRRGGRSG